MNQTIEAHREAGSGTIAQRLRLGSGLILFSYVLFHYINHSLGHISLPAMERMLNLQNLIVGSLPGQFVLYGALLTHSVLGVWRLSTFRSMKRPVWEWAQILLGLAIPWYLASHIIYTRGAEALLGVEVDYHHELLLLWPGATLQQSTLLIIVWIHGCLGVHFWLRIRSWYDRAFPYFAGAVALIPTVALTGWIAAARRLLDDLQTRAAISEEARIAYEQLLGANNFMIQNLRPIEYFAQWIILAIIAVLVAIMVLRWYLQRFGKRILVKYGDGFATRVAPGHTLLEVSREAGIPHMAVCGGRARCSTCRTLIMEGIDHLSEPTSAESLLLAKINAGPEVRLACQARVLGDILIRPIIPVRSDATSPRHADAIGWGVERDLAVFFLDVRGFSRISEKSLPYDVVFILNGLFDEVGAAIENAGGYIDKFMGDGIMALFGLVGTSRDACRNALTAAIDAHAAATRASDAMQEHLSEPLRIGVGIHIGQAVVGRVGKTSDQVSPSRLTAIGESVNIAARLETATKELGTGIVASARVFETAEIEIDEAFGNRSHIHVHNISEPIDVVGVRDMEKLKRLLEGEPASNPAASKPAGKQPPGRRRSGKKSAAAKKKRDANATGL